MNYKLTLAFLKESSDEYGITCLGGISDVTIYKPLPHTGMGLKVSSWGKEVGCDVVSALMMKNRENVLAKEKEGGKENASVVAGEMEEDREEVEPDA